ncbi:hypothetical protein PR048_028382 [Dryococelus australis]|uniref:Uncharacterized protein n=1 Tax=Dryococelus australis TaxID=614101 RepID=A0ABQ9GJ32_9NEOP|nr:hypothetical protein PR048_028382 [Dryococelus australis]
MGRGPVVAAERLTCSPPSMTNRIKYPVGPLPDNHMWESCRTMPTVVGFSRGSPITSALSFRCCYILTSITLIGSQDLALVSACKERDVILPRHLPPSGVEKCCFLLRLVCDVTCRRLPGAGWYVTSHVGAYLELVSACKERDVILPRHLPPSGVEKCCFLLRLVCDVTCRRLPGAGWYVTSHVGAYLELVSACKERDIILPRHLPPSGVEKCCFLLRLVCDVTCRRLPGAGWYVTSHVGAYLELVSACKERDVILPRHLPPSGVEKCCFLLRLVCDVTCRRLPGAGWYVTSHVGAYLELVSACKERDVILPRHLPPSGVEKCCFLLRLVCDVTCRRLPGAGWYVTSHVGAYLELVSACKERDVILPRHLPPSGVEKCCFLLRLVCDVTCRRLPGAGWYVTSHVGAYLELVSACKERDVILPRHLPPSGVEKCCFLLKLVCDVTCRRLPGAGWYVTSHVGAYLELVSACKERDVILPRHLPPSGVEKCCFLLRLVCDVTCRRLPGAGWYVTSHVGAYLELVSACKERDVILPRHLPPSGVEKCCFLLRLVCDVTCRRLPGAGWYVTSHVGAYLELVSACKERDVILPRHLPPSGVEKCCFLLKLVCDVTCRRLPGAGWYVTSHVGAYLELVSACKERDVILPRHLPPSGVEKCCFLLRLVCDVTCRRLPGAGWYVTSHVGAYLELVSACKERDVILPRHLPPSGVEKCCFLLRLVCDVTCRRLPGAGWYVTSHVGAYLELVSACKERDVILPRHLPPSGVEKCCFLLKLVCDVTCRRLPGAGWYVTSHVGAYLELVSACKERDVILPRHLQRPSPRGTMFCLYQRERSVLSALSVLANYLIGGETVERFYEIPLSSFVGKRVFKSLLNALQ